MTQVFRMNRQAGHITVLVAGLLLGLSSATTMAADVSPALAELIKAADSEKRLRLTWSDETLGGVTGVQEIQADMNKKFGTKIEFQFAPSTISMDQLGNQLTAELKAGRASRLDAFLTSSSSAGRLASADFFHQVDWIALLPDRIRPDMVEANGKLVRFVTYVAGVTYNSKLLPNPPKTLAGYLDPMFKGRLASTGSASAFDILGSTDFLGPEKAIEYAKSLSGQVAGLMRCSDGERLASGEFLALIFDCGGSGSARLADKGAPLAQVILQDFVQLRYFYLGVPKHAAQPNAAKLFIAYMMTAEGQKMAWKHWFSDLHMFPESVTAKQLADSQIDMKVAKDIGIDWLERHPEGDAAKREIVKILR